MKKTRGLFSPVFSPLPRRAFWCWVASAGALLSARADFAAGGVSVTRTAGAPTADIVAQQTHHDTGAGNTRKK